MRQNFTITNRMSNTIKTKMVAERKPDNTDKEDKAEKGRRTVKKCVSFFYFKKCANL